MIDVVSATWAVLFVSGLLAQTVSAALYRSRTPNQYGGILSILLLVSSVPVAFAAYRLYVAVLLTLLVAYLSLNAWVQIMWRFHALRTRRQVLRSATSFSALLLIFAALIYVGSFTEQTLAIASVLINAYVLVKVSRILGKARLPANEEIVKGPQPTVSMAVPARNETHALTRHLKSVVSSNYKKLEVLVADDCSQDDTAQIIRSFAHDGVRFLEGQTPEGSWIGKNRAYQMLADEASGEYIVFSGVDTRYEPDVIKTLINHMRLRKLDMVSVMPQHEKLTVWSMLIQPIRYLMMIVMTSVRNPAVLSTVWIIRKDSLKAHGGFAAVENSIVPEQYFAMRLRKRKKYRFVVAPHWLGLTTFKKPSSQADTAIRYIYPRLRKSIANHAVLSVVLALMLGVPLWTLVAGIVTEWDSAAALSAFSLAGLLLAYSVLIAETYPPRTLVVAPLYLVAGLVSMYWLSLRSMVGYELDSVIWKGRNVCYPVMMHEIHRRRR